MAISADLPGGGITDGLRAELAALANLSRQTVNQLLAQAEGEGLLRRSYRCLWLRG